MAPTNIFVDGKYNKLRFFLDPNQFSSTKKHSRELIAKIKANGGTWGATAADEADVVLVAIESTTANDYAEKYKNSEKPVVLDDNWVDACISSGRVLGKQEKWGGLQVLPLEESDDEDQLQQMSAPLEQALLADHDDPVVHVATPTQARRMPVTPPAKSANTRHVEGEVEELGNQSKPVAALTNSLRRTSLQPSIQGDARRLAPLRWHRDAILSTHSASPTNAARVSGAIEDVEALFLRVVARERRANKSHPGFSIVETLSQESNTKSFAEWATWVYENRTVAWPALFDIDPNSDEEPISPSAELMDARTDTPRRRPYTLWDEGYLIQYALWLLKRNPEITMAQVYGNLVQHDPLGPSYRSKEAWKSLCTDTPARALFFMLQMKGPDSAEVELARRRYEEYQPTRNKIPTPSGSKHSRSRWEVVEIDSSSEGWPSPTGSVEDSPSPATHQYGLRSGAKRGGSPVEEEESRKRRR